MLTLPLVLLLICSSFTLMIFHVYLRYIRIKRVMVIAQVGDGIQYYLCIWKRANICCLAFRYWFIWLHIYMLLWLLLLIAHGVRIISSSYSIVNGDFHIDTTHDLFLVFFLFISIQRCHTLLCACARDRERERKKDLFIRQMKWWNADDADISKGSMKGKRERMTKYINRLN